MNEVVKAGVLEVTVVQALGVALPRTSRRKASLVARVTVDGTTKSGQSAQRSNHPVWFPAEPLNPGDGDASSLPSTSGTRGSSSSGSRKSGPSARVFSRAMGSSGSESGSGSGNNNGNAHLEEREQVGGSLHWARARYGGGARGGGGGSIDGGSGSAAGSGEDVEAGDGRGNCSVARGMLFEIREFYGPTRIVVELVSGGHGGGGSGAGGTVLGACEARLAEALVGRGGGVGSSSKLGKAASFGLDKESQGQRAVGGFPPLEEKHDSPLLLAERYDSSSGAAAAASIGDISAGVAAPVQPRAALAPSHSATADTGSESNRGRDGDGDGDGDGDAPDLPSQSPRQEEAGGGAGADVGADVDGAGLAEPAPVSAAAAAVDTANTTPEGCVGCLPGGGIFSRWRRGHRRRGGVRSQRSASGVAGAVVTRATDNGGGVGVDRTNSVGTGEKSRLSGTRKSSSDKSGSCSGSGDSSVRKVGSHESGTMSTSLSKKAESSKPKTLTLEEAELLATSNWGGGGANGSARDIWKELVHVGGGGNGAKGKGSGAGLGGVALGPSGPAVRLRLRFIPLWDCLSDGGSANGLGALHAAARDGDARLVTSLVHLWQSLSPGSQVLSLPCRRGLTPIQHCIEAGKESALRDLLRGIARDSLRGGGKEGEDTPLHTAIKAGEEGMLRMLLAQTRRTEMPSRVLNAFRLGLGAPPSTMVDSVGSDGLTPLALAAICGNETMVKCLLEEGANAAWVDARGMTPIAHAAHGGNLLAVRALLKAKATGSTGSGVPGLRRSRLARMACAPCKTNEEGMGPVALAAASGSAQVVSELVRADIPYRTRDRDGRTPLHLAARNGHIPVLRVLVAEMRKNRDKRGPTGGGGDAGDGAPPGDNTLMMDGGPFKLRNLDLYGRTAHATAILHQHHQAAAFLEAAAAELEPPRIPKDEDAAPKLQGSNSNSNSSGKRRGGHPPRASTASPVARLAQWSGSSSAQGSGTSGRPSPVSSGGLGSGGSVLDSCNSYEYVESDQE